MKANTLTATTALMALGACSAGTGFFSSSETLAVGTTGNASANGLPFAVSTSVVQDLETAGTMDVKVVRALTDWESGATRLVISSEKLTLSPGDIGSGLDNMTITLGGETLVFNSGSAPASNGQGPWSAYVNTQGAVSGTGTVYNYEYGSNPALSNEFDTEAFFVFGFETDPDEIVALMSTVTYNGSFDGYGQVIDPQTGGVISSEEGFNGSIALMADFDNNNITGDLNGAFDYDGTVFMTSFAAPIQGNGYIGSLDSMSCTGATCASSSQIAGAFYGTDGAETSGLLAVDVQVDPNSASPYRMIGGGGFTATQ